MDLPLNLGALRRPIKKNKNARIGKRELMLQVGKAVIDGCCRKHPQFHFVQQNIVAIVSYVSCWYYISLNIFKIF
ncbi:MAG: hypothetical protein FWC28_06525 [Proteobacteria bacterium]|nr:hypothetical protein [Cystobacterineae bacterium]MCL2258956.1 hypothetical protein [Cystobacterineae bacterium]MCL2314886.1 hypothetical protein [Pseudomonadota bacterium]